MGEQLDQIRRRALVGAVVTVSAALALTGCAFRPPAPIPQPTPAPATSTAPPTMPATPDVTPSPTPVPLPDPAVLAKILDKVPRKDLGVTGVFVANTDGVQLYANTDKPLQPASTMKVLTTMMAADVLGPDTTFDTKVVEVRPGTIALVGGGDPFLVTAHRNSGLWRASLEDLAKATAAALKGRKSVKLVYDASLFSGPGWGANWRESWKKTMTRIGALTVDRGKLSKWVPAPDPAKAAAEAFVKQLKAAKVSVTSVKAGKAPKDGAVLAKATSAPVSTMIIWTLRNSYNLGAEVLARHAGLVHVGTGSFDAGSETIRWWLKGHGLWDADSIIDGGSGLSLTARVTPAMLAKAVGRAFDGEQYAAVLQGLPIAGVSGTLKGRFNDKNEAAGRNVVHAKTGALNNVSTLAGYVVDKDGAILVFAALANKTNGHDAAAQNWLDRTAALLATCGCR